MSQDQPQQNGRKLVKVELQGHGGPVLLDMLLRRVLDIKDVRIARPGESSERAFLNDKLDLTQAEAIADLIDASSEQAARSAMHSLQGEFSRRSRIAAQYAHGQSRRPLRL